MLNILQYLDCKNATQQGDIADELIQEDNLFYRDNILFPIGLKKLVLTLFTRKVTLLKKLVRDQWVYYQFYQKLSNVACRIKFMGIDIKSYPRLKAILEKDASTSIH